MSYSQEHYLLIGTYTKGKSEGVYVYKFNSTTGDVAMVSSVKASNPSYLALSPDEKFVYAVNLIGSGVDRMKAHDVQEDGWSETGMQ